MRLLAVVESLDNGKPIRESRDADVQIVARHLYHHAGWAQLTDTEMSDWKPVGLSTLSDTVQGLEADHLHSGGGGTIMGLREL